MATQEWTVAHSRDGQWVWIYRYDLRARIWSWLEGKVCGCWCPDWMWRIKVADVLFHVEQWMCRRAGTAQDKCKVAEIPIDKDLLLRLSPDMAFLYEDDEAA